VIARNLQKLRHEKGWSIAKLADKVGIDRRQVIRHLNGQRPHPQNLKFYAEAFSVTVDRVFAAGAIGRDEICVIILSPACSLGGRLGLRNLGFAFVGVAAAIESSPAECCRPLLTHAAGKCP
jgi:transcriptional regulator with XRE-family HTH domain